VSTVIAVGLIVGVNSLRSIASKPKVVWFCVVDIDILTTIDVKNITLQIKIKKKHVFFHFYKKNIKNMHKNIKLQYPFK